MRNRRKQWLGIWILLLLLLTGCQKQAVSNMQNSEYADDSEQNVQGPENMEDKVAQNQEDIPSNKQEIPQKSAILETAKRLDTEGMVYYVPNAHIESSLQQEIALYKDNLLVWGYGTNPKGETGFHLAFISLQTGEVLGEKTFVDMELPNAQVCGEVIAVTDWGTGKVYFLNASLSSSGIQSSQSADDKENFAYSFDVTEEYQTGTEYSAIYVSPNTEKIYAFTQEGVKVMDTQTGKTDVLFDEAVMLFASSYCGDSVTVTYTDKNTQFNENGVVDLTESTAKKIPFEGVFQNVEYQDGIWLAGVLGEGNPYYLGKSGRPNSFVPPEENAMVTLLANPLRLMTTTYDENGTPNMTLYSPEGKFLSQCRLPVTGASMIYEPIWSEADGGYFFIIVSADGKDMLLFWDLSIPSAGEDIMLKSEYHGETQIDSVISDVLFRRATNISEKYGVEIVMGEQTDETYGSFLMAQELDETYIAEALGSVEYVLSQYPEGFMEQLLYGSQKKLEIHLTGAFTMSDLPDDEINGFTSYVGLAEEQEGKNVIVVDITTPGSLEQILFHEFMHLIDNKLVFDANIRDDALYSEETWNDFNPAGFQYTEDKLHLPENIYNDGYDAYFIDVYSRTFAREDRARIMEYAMVEADWAFSSAFGRYEKLKYLCECIRDAFDTEGWPEQTVWEEMLEGIDVTFTYQPS